MANSTLIELSCDDIVYEKESMHRLNEECLYVESDDEILEKDNDNDTVFLHYAPSIYIQPKTAFHRLLNRRLFRTCIKGLSGRKPRRRRSRRISPCLHQTLHIFILLLEVFFGTILTLIVLTYVFWPSYTHLLPHYKSLRDQIKQSDVPGRGNLRNEKVFIATSIFDEGGHLASGAWGQSLLNLIDLLGQQNVYLSIYENDGGPKARSALSEFKKKVNCNSSLVFEDHLDVSSLPTVTLPDGSIRIKRIAYLAEVRNRALTPLDSDELQQTKFDKLLFLNDVFFNPIDAAHLLFSTNASQDGLTNYRAACAVDFINAFKFYDTFASRDLQGYQMGLPFFPWFASAGDAFSRKDVLAQKDAVRVRSCWGGMVAFDAKYFQGFDDGDEQDKYSDHSITDLTPNKNRQKPVRFRADPDIFSESSECCLIQADIQDIPSQDVDQIRDTGIVMNPFIRVAYDPVTLSWLGVTRRFERLYSLIHDILNRLVHQPHFNSRRKEIIAHVEKNSWVIDDNGVKSLKTDHIVHAGGFCSIEDLQVLITKDFRKYDWESISYGSPNIG